MSIESIFHYPDEMEIYPFDTTCGQIARVLEARSWQVPGIQMSFKNSISGIKTIETINGNDFKLWFCRPQVTIFEDDKLFNILSGVTQLNIPGNELHVYGDFSGPTYYKYVGLDWESDKEIFMRSPKLLSKAHGEPRTYLKYVGSWDSYRHIIQCRGTEFTVYGTPIPRRVQSVALYLIHNNDWGREYDLELGDKSYYSTWHVMQEFDQWLKENVLNYIQKQSS